MATFVLTEILPSPGIMAVVMSQVGSSPAFTVNHVSLLPNPAFGESRSFRESGWM